MVYEVLSKLLKGGYIGEYLGGCQNYGPFLVTLNTRCSIVIGTQKGTIILSTTHIVDYYRVFMGDTRILDYGSYGRFPKLEVPKLGELGGIPP